MCHHVTTAIYCNSESASILKDGSVRHITVTRMETLDDGATENIKQHNYNK